MATRLDEEEIAPEAAASESPTPVIIDLGKKKRKHVKRLRKGRGRLAERIGQHLDDLQEMGHIEGGAQPVVVVVRQKARKKSRRWRWY